MLSTRAFTLENGLTVILREVHTAPLISTWAWYRVGSRNESEGATGLSHWVEHMMFKGSALFGKGEIMRVVQRYGGELNAFTSHDFTAYHETLPAQQAELALRIESDRMLNATFDPAEVASERSVIISEREGSENEPPYMLYEEMTAVAFRVHPYHHQTIGWKGDLQVITRDQLYAHYRQHYAPNNAVLIAVGDFDTDAYLAMVRRYFDDLPPVTLPDSQVRQEPPPLGERRLTLRMPGHAPLVRVSYHTPPVSHPDYIPLVVLDAVLSGGKAMFAFDDSQARSARLYRALVETQLASSASSGYHPSLDPYLLTLTATVRDGRTPAEVEAALLGEVDKLTRDRVQANELAVAIRQAQAQFAYNSESAEDQALTLGFLEMLDKHTRFDGLLGELAAVTPDDVLRVARTYLAVDNRVVGWFVPTDEAGNGDAPESGPRALHPVREPRLWHYSGAHAAPQPRDATASGTAAVRPAGIEPETIVRATLDNGITVLIVENPASASVNIEGRLSGGSLVDTEDTAGLASLTSAMLRRGTRQHSFQELNILLDNVGASLETACSHTSTGFEGQALADDLPLLVNALAELLMQPDLPEQELAKLRGQRLTQLGVLENDTGYRAQRALFENLYAGHPWSRPISGSRTSVAALQRDDLLANYHRHFHPANLVIAVAGAIRAQQVLDLLHATLGRWRVNHAAPVFSVPDAATPPRIATERVHLPGKAQADLLWGVVAMPRTSPDYYAAMLANLILGRLGLMGRLGAHVRDDLGLAYYASSALTSAHGPDPWLIYAGVNPVNLEPAVAAILDEVRRLRDEPVSDQELDDSRTYLTGALPLRLETNDAIASFLLNLEQHQLGLDYVQRYPEIIYGVTKADIRRVAQRYLTLDRYVLTAAGTLGR